MVKAVASRNSGQWLVTCGQWGRAEEWKDERETGKAVVSE